MEIYNRGRYLDASRSEATRRVYAQALRHFRLNGGDIPTTPELLADYLARCAGRYAISTIQCRLAAIHDAHITAGLPSPVSTSLVGRVMRGIRRIHGSGQQQATPLLKDDLMRLLVEADRTNTALATRDKALLLIGFAGAFRRSELVALRVTDLSFVDEGVELIIRKSKTDQESRGRAVFIPRAEGPMCPAAALLAWLRTADIKDGPVFQGLKRNGGRTGRALSAQSVSLILKRLAAATQISAQRVSGHSLRSGFCTQAILAGHSSQEVMAQTGHRSITTLTRYIRLGERRKQRSLL